MPFEIRPYQAKDLNDLYQICLQTADGGKDASHLFADHKLIGHYYAAPYALIAPEVCFVATNNNKPCGYIVGCQSSVDFCQRSEEHWFPALRQQYPQREPTKSEYSDKMIALIHQGINARPEYADYPAHLHINLLPETQGAGLGRKLIEAFIENLKRLGVSGLHLEVSRSNHNAINFYEKMGFKVINEFDHSIGYGMKL